MQSPCFSDPQKFSYSKKLKYQDSSLKDLTRIFNTALVNSLMSSHKRDYPEELYSLTQNPAFQAILNAIRHLAHVKGITEQKAAEEIIATFYQLKEVWGDYISKEGLEYIKTHFSN